MHARLEGFIGFARSPFKVPTRLFGVLRGEAVQTPFGLMIRRRIRIVSSGKSTVVPRRADDDHGELFLDPELLRGCHPPSSMRQMLKLLFGRDTRGRPVPGCTALVCGPFLRGVA